MGLYTYGKKTKLDNYWKEVTSYESSMGTHGSGCARLIINFIYLLKFLKI